MVEGGCEEVWWCVWRIEIEGWAEDAVEGRETEGRFVGHLDLFTGC